MQDSQNYELDPNFAVVCSFLERFGKHIGDNFARLTIGDLKAFLEAKRVDLRSPFVKLHLTLFRGIGSYHKPEEWEKGVIKFCKDFPDGDEVLVKEKGYSCIPITAKLRILKNLFEDQFEYNDRFNKRINDDIEEGTSLRHDPIGKDKLGRSYWFMLDKECGMRLFRGWYNDLTKDETWNIVCSEVEELESFIEKLEESEDLKQEDLILPKHTDMSPLKQISTKDILTTATEDAAIAVHFSRSLSSPRFFRPPEPRSRAQVLKEEKRNNMPHCDVVITRLSQRDLEMYRKGSKDSNVESRKDCEGVINNSKSKSLSKTNDKGSVKEDDSIVKEDSNTNVNQQIKKAESYFRNKETGCEVNPGELDNELKVSCKHDVPSVAESATTKCYRTAHSISAVSNSKIVSSSDQVKSCTEVEMASTNHSVKQSTEDTNCKNLQACSVEKGSIVIDCRGDTSYNSTTENEKVSASSMKEKTCENNSVKVSDYCVRNDLSCINSDSVDDKEAFDNAIQDLLQLEGKSQSKESESVQSQSEPDLEGFDLDKTITTDLNEEKEETKCGTKLSSNIESDNSFDHDRRAIDNALKDLIQLEEMISQGSPASICMSPPQYDDFNKSSTQDSVKQNNVSSSDDPKGVIDTEMKNISSGKYDILNKNLENVQVSIKDVHCAMKKEKDNNETSVRNENNVRRTELSNGQSSLDSENFGSKPCLIDVQDKLTHVQETETKKVDKQNLKGVDNNKSHTKLLESIDPSAEMNVLQKSGIKTENLSVCSISGKDNHVIDCKSDMKIKQQVSAEFKAEQTDSAGQVYSIKDEISETNKILSTQEADGKFSVPSTSSKGSNNEEKLKIKTEYSNEKNHNVIPNSNKKVEENNKEEKRRVQKKHLSMMVGDELIQIEEVSDDIDSATESADSKTDSASESDAVKTSKSLKDEKDGLGSKIQEIINSNLKVVCETKDEIQSKAMKKRSSVSKIDINKEKEMMKSIYVSSSNVANSIMPHIIYISPGKDSNVCVNSTPHLVQSVPAVSTSDTKTVKPNIVYIPVLNGSQSSVSKPPQSTPAYIPISKQNNPLSVADVLKAIYVPLVPVSGSLTQGLSNSTSSAKSPQLNTQSSVLIKPAVTVTDSKISSGEKPADVTLPFVPKIVYASGQVSALSQQLASNSSSQYISILPKQNNSSQNKNSKETVKSVLKACILKTNVTKGSGQLKCLEGKDHKGVSVERVNFVVGRDAVHSKMETVCPPNKKLVIAGPRGKFYDKDTGYEVDIPSSENLKHIPGAVYAVSGVVYTEEVMKQVMAGKLHVSNRQLRKANSGWRASKKDCYEDSSSSDEEFTKMLESDLEKTDDEEEFDDPDYDYEKISQRVKAAKDKKLPPLKAEQELYSEDEESEESGEETVPLVLGRNAKRAAARRMNYKEPDKLEIVTDESSDEVPSDVDDSEMCKVCNSGKDPATILLCDKCDASYHMSCLCPPLSLLPLEDWYCPVCDHEILIERLKEKLKMLKKAHRKFTREKDRISQKTFSIDTENIVLGERRSCRNRKDVVYTEDSYDKMIQKAVKEYNNPKKADSSDSETETESSHKCSRDQTKPSEMKATKRQRGRSRKSAQKIQKDSSGKSRAKKRKLTSLDDNSCDSGSDYVQSESSASSDSEKVDPDADDMAIGGAYFTSSGRKTKHVSYV